MFPSRSDMVVLWVWFGLPVLAFVTVNAMMGWLWAFLLATPLGIAALLVPALTFGPILRKTPTAMRPPFDV